MDYQHLKTLNENWQVKEVELRDTKINKDAGQISVRDMLENVSNRMVKLNSGV